MALIKCRDCGNDVSTEAKACPKCGAKVIPPKPPKRPTSPIAKVVGGVLLAGFVVAAILGPQAEREATQKREAAARAEEQRRAALTPEQRQAEDAVVAKRQAEEEANRAAVEKEKAAKTARLQMAGAGAMTLKRASKDPDTFEFKSVIVHPSGAACYEYRAKNSFGAMLAGSAVLSPKGKLLVEEQNGNSFVKVWNAECTKADGEDIAATLKRLEII
jgi:hypothetical protein